MEIRIPSAIIVVLLSNQLCALGKTRHNNLINTLDPGAITEASISHHPKHHVRFEDQSSERPIKFDDDPKEHDNFDIDTAEEESLNLDTVNGEGNSDQNDRLSKSRTIEGKTNKIKFEDSFDGQEINEHDPGRVVFEDDNKYAESDNEYTVESETDLGTVGKPIKFKNQNDHYISDTKIRDTDMNTVTERVVFADSNRQEEPAKNTIRRPRRKPRFQSPSQQIGPGLNYQGGGYLGPTNPGPVNSNAGYPTYPVPGYTVPSYSYPGNPTTYPRIAFPTPAYPGTHTYPGAYYPPMNAGYGIYKPSGYQVPGNQRPTANPDAYPSPGLGGPNGHTNTRYPNQEFSGSQNPVAQKDQPGAPYPVPVYPYPQPYPGNPNAQYPLQTQGQYRPPGSPWANYQGYQGGLIRPSRRPKSLPERAVSAVAEALTSIALYDDYQCVPKILCEVAGGSTSSSSMLLKASASLQPLLSLLQAYNGVSSSPLFIFSRAAIMGVTANGNPAECRRAYPQCPNDPEKLINYLNNHNGGFFRFFGQPEIPQKQQNLEQFYNYLSGQYGFQQQSQQNYGLLNQYSYGLLGQNPKAKPYNYGQNQNTYRNGKASESEIEERIQNKPGINVLDDDDIEAELFDDKGSKWSFPDEVNVKNGNDRENSKIKNEPARPPRESKTLKFPDDRTENRLEAYIPKDYHRNEKKIFFPGESHYQINTNYQTTTSVNPEEYVFDYKHNFYVKRPKVIREERPTTYKYDDVVYVVRGNGDPNHPEIVKVTPGQRI